MQSARSAASEFFAPLGAKQLAFNGQGACPRLRAAPAWCATVNRATLVPDESLTHRRGRGAPWNSLMWSLMTDVCRAMGVRTDVPFSELTDPKNADIVFDGPAVKKHILYKAEERPTTFAELDFTYLQRRVHRRERACQGQGREGA